MSRRFRPIGFYSLAQFREREEFPLVILLADYLFAHLPFSKERPDVLGLLDYAHEKLAQALLWWPNMCTSLICRSFLAILAMAHARQEQRLRAWGSRTNRQYFKQGELVQAPLRRKDIPTELAPLCQMLLADALLVARLLRGALFYFGKRDPHWQLFHQAAAVVLTRLFVLWVELRHTTDGWVAQVCLRWALRQTWQTLFGAELALPDLLQPVRMTVQREREVLRLLIKKGHADEAVLPEPLAEVLRCWQAGDLPPAAPPRGAGREPVLVRFWV
jgi:hypothetical protein